MNCDDVSSIIERLRKSVRHEACWTCDCLQGLLTQLELDANQDVAGLVGPLKVSREQMHGCLGCDPCPPGEVYGDYLRGTGRGACSNDEE